MKRIEALIGIVVAYTMITAGVVWQFGPWGLVGSGAVAMIVLAFFEIKE